jgi:hypothetical protein
MTKKSKSRPKRAPKKAHPKPTGRIAELLAGAPIEMSDIALPEVDIARENAEQARDYLLQTQPRLLRILIGLSDDASESSMALSALAEAANLVDVALLELNSALDKLGELRP